MMETNLRSFIHSFIQAAHIPDFALQHSLSPYTSALTTLYSIQSTPSPAFSSIMNHAISSAVIHDDPFVDTSMSRGKTKGNFHRSWGHPASLWVLNPFSPSCNAFWKGVSKEQTLTSSPPCKRIWTSLLTFQMLITFTIVHET